MAASADQYRLSANGLQTNQLQFAVDAPNVSFTGSVHAKDNVDANSISVTRRVVDPIDGTKEYSWSFQVDSDTNALKLVPPADETNGNRAGFAFLTDGTFLSDLLPSDLGAGASNTTTVSNLNVVSALTSPSVQTNVLSSGNTENNTVSVLSVLEWSAAPVVGGSSSAATKRTDSATVPKSSKPPKKASTSLLSRLWKSKEEEEEEPLSNSKQQEENKMASSTLVVPVTKISSTQMETPTGVFDQVVSNTVRFHAPDTTNTDQDGNTTTISKVHVLTPNAEGVECTTDATVTTVTTLGASSTTTTSSTEKTTVSANSITTGIVYTDQLFLKDENEFKDYKQIVNELQTVVEPFRTADVSRVNTTLNIGNTTALTGTINIGTSTTGKTINIGNTADLVVLRGTLTTPGTMTTINTAVIESTDTSITLNKNGTTASAIGLAGIRVKGDGATDAASILLTDASTWEFKTPNRTFLLNQNVGTNGTPTFQNVVITKAEGLKIRYDYDNDEKSYYGVSKNGTDLRYSVSSYNGAVSHCFGRFDTNGTFYDWLRIGVQGLKTYIPMVQDMASFTISANAQTIKQSAGTHNYGTKGLVMLTSTSDFTGVSFSFPTTDVVDYRQITVINNCSMSVATQTYWTLRNTTRTSIDPGTTATFVIASSKWYCITPTEPLSNGIVVTNNNQTIAQSGGTLNYGSVSTIFVSASPDQTYTGITFAFPTSLPVSKERKITVVNNCPMSLTTTTGYYRQRALHTTIDSGASMTFVYDQSNTRWQCIAVC